MFACDKKSYYKKFTPLCRLPVLIYISLQILTKPPYLLLIIDIHYNIPTLSRNFYKIFCKESSMINII